MFTSSYSLHSSFHVIASKHCSSPTDCYLSIIILWSVLVIPVMFSNERECYCQVFIPIFWSVCGTTWTWDKWLPELGTSWDILRYPEMSQVFLGLLGPGTSDCQSLGHPGISWDIPRRPREFLGLLGLGTNDCQSLGHPGIPQNVLGYSWDYLHQGQVIVRAWDIPGYPEDVPGYSWDYLDLGQLIVRALDKWLSELGKSWDIPRCLKLWQSLVPGPNSPTNTVMWIQGHIGNSYVWCPRTTSGLQECPGIPSSITRDNQGSP